jgi:hypothetical protein
MTMMMMMMMMMMMIVFNKNHLEFLLHELYG